MRRVIRRVLPQSAVNQIKRWRTAYRTKVTGVQSATEYWTQHHVDRPDAGFSTVAQSLSHYKWRNQVNPGHIELMPVDDVSGKVVLDYGCGPGNDVIGFGHFSRPARLLACDVSSTAIAIARGRAAVHGINVEFAQLRETPVTLPFEAASIDVIHTAGVLHHTPDPDAILREFHRVLRPGGEVRIMVYNHDSIWMHLYLSYVLMIEQGQYRGMSPADAFRLTTDGESCPIARCYRPLEFVAAGRRAGFDARFIGAGTTIVELEMLPKRWAAVRDRRLAEESRDFLYGLTLNACGWPVHNGNVAGVNGYYRFHRR